MKPIILDCSVTLAWCFHDETTEYSDFILHYVRKNSAIVPSLWFSEVSNVLLTAIRKDRMDWDGALFFLENLSRLPIRAATITSKEYFSKIADLAYQNHLTTYDSTYLFLAIREKKPLATLDKDLKECARNLKLAKLSTI